MDHKLNEDQKSELIKIIKSNNKSEYQIAGHLGSIFFYEDKLFKKAKSSEIEFYEFLYGQNASNQMRFLINLIPKFYGCEIFNEDMFLVLENLNYSCTNPNSMDLKLGKVTFMKNGSSSKIERKKKKCMESTTNTLGFRISGLSIKDNNNSNNDIILDQQQINENIKTKENMKDYFTKFVENNGELQRNILESIIQQINQILEFFKLQNEKYFIASSLYIVVGKNNVVKVKMIDFANIENSEGQLDNNVIEPLEVILDIWNSILNNKSHIQF